MAQSVTHYNGIPAAAGGCGPVRMERVLEMRLDQREVRRLDGNACGTQILCAGGRLWVTQQGDPDDHFLCSGDRFTVTRPGPVVIQGMGGC